MMNQISRKTYILRISNVGVQNSLNFKIAGHRMKLVEVEGTHTVQNTYSVFNSADYCRSASPGLLYCGFQSLHQRIPHLHSHSSLQQFS